MNVPVKPASAVFSDKLWEFTIVLSEIAPELPLVLIALGVLPGVTGLEPKASTAPKLVRGSLNTS